MAHYSAGHIRKRRKSKNSDRWEWQAFLVVTQDGDRPKRQITRMTGIACTRPRRGEHPETGKGARQALEFVRAWRDELVTADAAPKAQVVDESVGEFVERYIKSLEVEPATIQGYGYLVPRIKQLDMPIAELTPQDVEQWKSDLEAAGVGETTRVKTVNLLRYACNWGVETGTLEQHPMRGVKSPKRPHHEPNPLDPSKLPKLQERLADLLQNSPEFADMCNLALNTGMRRGELCALRWTDVDDYEDGTFDGYIHVNRAVSTKQGGTYIKPYPKGGRGSRRKVPINNSIRQILNRRRVHMLKYDNDLSKCFVFGYSLSGTSYPSPGYVSKQWGMFAKMNNFRGVEGPLRFQDLRDTFATVALVNGIPVGTVASILGHANPTTTWNYYHHWIPDKNKDAMDDIDSWLNT